LTQLGDFFSFFSVGARAWGGSFSGHGGVYTPVGPFKLRGHRGAFAVSGRSALGTNLFFPGVARGFRIPTKKNNKKKLGPKGDQARGQPGAAGGGGARFRFRGSPKGVFSVLFSAPGGFIFVSIPPAVGASFGRGKAGKGGARGGGSGSPGGPRGGAGGGGGGRFFFKGGGGGGGGGLGRWNCGPF